MRARFIWALLTLAAVFSMHGLTCAAAQDPPGGAPTHAMAMGPAAPTLTPAAHGDAAHGDAAHGDAAPGHGRAAVAPVTGDGGGHGAMVHALMVCLAVLAGGVAAALAALAVWLARRRVRAWSARARSGLRVVLDRGRPPLLGPELSRLCVLRI